MTFVLVASYPPRRRGDTPRRGRRRTSGRVIGEVCSGGGCRRRFNDHHLVSRLSCGAETTLGRYHNHLVFNKKMLFTSTRLLFSCVGKKEREKKKRK